MHKRIVQGEIKALGWRDGGSGRLIGDITGLFQGYRLNRLTASQCSTYAIEAENGTLSLTLSQETRIRHLLPSRPQEHPFKNGKDPFQGVELVESRLPDLPQDASTVHPRGNMATVVKLAVNPDVSTGMFAGALGEMTVELTEPAINGYMEIETNDGVIKLDFYERMENAQVINTLWINGSKSSGIYQNAHGELVFQVSIYPPNFARGTYSGVIWTEG